MSDADNPHALLKAMRRVREHVAAEGAGILQRWEGSLNRGDFRAGATNLARYLALRELDLRSLQKPLVGPALST